jgi:hypothetical protein
MKMALYGDLVAMPMDRLEISFLQCFFLIPSKIGIGAFPSQMLPVRVKNDLEDKIVVKACAGGSHVLAITSVGTLCDDFCRFSQN